MDKITLKQILASNQKEVENASLLFRALPSDDFPRRVFVGVRRAGKSYMLFQKMQERLHTGIGWDEMLYLNFEDDRLVGFQVEDFNLLLECHSEMYGKRPMLFLDEVQIVDGWEKFARRLADAKYDVWITGSNARMLSSEIMTTLGGRYIMEEVFPYHFKEYLRSKQIPFDLNTLLRDDERANLMRAWSEYFYWGGMPECASLSAKRSYLSSIFQKIYLGDICSRNKIANPNNLRLMLKKLSESVGQPVTYNRLASVLSSVNGKISMPTVSKYIDECEAAWLLLRLRNVSASFADKESACKYYFIDNGVLNLFLLGGETALLENLVALSLFRLYGHEADNERVYFYRDKVEVDFYVPEDEVAIQVSYSITQSEETFRREIDALGKLPKVLSCKQRMVLTYDEESSVEDEFGTIQIIPLWKWLITMRDNFDMT